jgi:hypothetical protein
MERAVEWSAPWNGAHGGMERMVEWSVHPSHGLSKSLPHCEDACISPKFICFIGKLHIEFFFREAAL